MNGLLDILHSFLLILTFSLFLRALRQIDGGV